MTLSDQTRITVLEKENSRQMELFKNIDNKMDKIQTNIENLVAHVQENCATRQDLAYKADKNIVDRHQRLLTKWTFWILSWLFSVIWSLIVYIFLK